MLRYWRRGLAWVILQPSENWHCCHTWRLVIPLLHFHKRNGSRMRITSKIEREFSSWEWWTTRLRGVWSCSRNSTDSSPIMKKKSSVFSKWSWQIGTLFASQQQRRLLLTQCLQFLDSKTVVGVEAIKPEQSTFMVRTMCFFLHFWTFPILQTYWHFTVQPD